MRPSESRCLLRPDTLRAAGLTPLRHQSLSGQPEHSAKRPTTKRRPPADADRRKRRSPSQGVVDAGGSLSQRRAGSDAIGASYAARIRARPPIIALGSGLRVLLIDGDERRRHYVLRGLREEGFAVDAVPAGAAGAGYALRIDYDAIVVGSSFSRQQQLGLVRRLRRVCGSAGILLLLARAAVAERVAALDAGADDCGPARLSFEELLVRIRGD